MPEYLTPGVYVEEVSFRAPSIEGVGTTTTAFAGPTATGPVGGMPYGGLPASGSPPANSPAGGIPELLTSFGDFQNIYGSYDNLSMSTTAPLPAKAINYMAMAVKAFFDNGGSMLYVSRVFANKPGSSTNTIDPGIASGGSSSSVAVSARFPGAFLNGQSVTVTLTASKTQNIGSLPAGSLLGVPGTGGGAATFYANGTGTKFMSTGSSPVELTAPFPSNLAVLTAQVSAPGTAGQAMIYTGLGLDPNHPYYIGNVLGVNPPRHIDQLQNQVYFQIASGLNTPDALFGALFPNWGKLATTDGTVIWVNLGKASWAASTAFAVGQAIIDSNGVIQVVKTAGTSGAAAPAWDTTVGGNTTDGTVTWVNSDKQAWKASTAFTAGELILDGNGNIELVETAGTSGAAAPAWSTSATSTASASFTLSKGNDGAEPMANSYATALQYCEPLEDIAIVATPGASIYTDANDIMIGSLIPHVERQRAYRVAILEAGPNLLDSDYESIRGQIDSSYSALYVPWVVTPNPLAVAGTSIPAEIAVPPSGFMAGIYARNDTQNSVAKAPANEVLLGAVDFERHISFGEQAVLNPMGINCLRFFPGRGFRVWGARTASSDSELMYINVRRYLIYLEHSIDNGTQWAVFENNGPSLWARMKDSIDSYLNAEFVAGNLLGTSPSDAYFVRCDRTTMTQNDLDNGRLICLVGVALLKPAEFVIFRIGQMTANARS